MIEIRQVNRLAQNKLEVTIGNDTLNRKFIVVANSKNEINSLSYSDELSEILGNNLRSARGFHNFSSVIQAIKLPYNLGAAMQ